MSLKINWPKIAALGSCVIMATTPIAGHAISYTIEKGDTLTKISTKFYGDKKYYDALAEFNGIENPDKIRAGSTIEVPELDVLINQGIIYYEVVKGDNLIKICEAFYQDASYYRELATYNKISNPNLIKVGDIVMVPLIRVLQNIRKNNQTQQYQTQPQQTVSTYTIQKGDKLSSIAKKFYGDFHYYHELAIYNGISDVSKIYAGDTIRIPSIEVLNNIRKNNQTQQTTHTTSSSTKKDLYTISKEKYGTDKYAYLIANLNGCNMNKKYNPNKLWLPAAYNMDKYLELQKSLDSYDGIKAYYIVEKGDTLYKISMKRYGTDKYVDFLASINALSNKNLINTGLILYAPPMYQEENHKSK